MGYTNVETMTTISNLNYEKESINAIIVMNLVCNWESIKHNSLMYFLLKPWDIFSNKLAS